MNHLISSQDISRAGYDEIFRRMNKFLDQGISPDLLRGKVVATMFFQPSTRTMLSFQSAFLRAGGGWVGVMGEQGISMEKGESFEDTIRTFSMFVDCLVLRHPDDDSAERAAKNSFVPVINAGSGSREHAVGVAMALGGMIRALGTLEGKKIGIYGTPGINRMCKAIVPIMGWYGIDLVIDDLGLFPLPKEIEQRATANGLKGLKYDKLDNFIGAVDLLICTRGLQKGIIPAGQFSAKQEEEVLKRYQPISVEHMKKLRSDAWLTMFLPRIFEIDTAVDADPRSLYSKPEPMAEACLAVATYLLGVEVA